MRFQSKKPLAFIVALLVFAACSSGIQSYSYKTKGVDLKKYKTFAWAAPADAEGEKRKDDKQYSGLILELSNAELEKKGFVLDTENPQAVFIFNTRVEDRIAYTQGPSVNVGFGFGGPGYYGGFSAPVAGGQVLANPYQEGVLIIEMYDTKTQDLLWRGWAKEEVTLANDIEADIKQAVKYIFMRLPVKHKS